MRRPGIGFSSDVSGRLFCENQRDIVIEALKTAKQSVVIAVAWINFNEYGSTINELLQNGVNIRIIVNDDVKNSRHAGIIRDLQNKGLQFKMIHMPKNSNYMHHKFCVIDEKMCMMVRLTGQRMQMKVILRICPLVMIGL